MADFVGWMRRQGWGFGTPSAPPARTIALPECITVADLAYRLSVKSSGVLTELLRGGCSATVNQALDREAAAFVAEGLGWQVCPAQSDGAPEAADEPACECRVRPAHQCPGAWEPGCDLGSNCSTDISGSMFFRNTSAAAALSTWACAMEFCVIEQYSSTLEPRRRQRLLPRLQKRGTRRCSRRRSARA
jgi:hypothetical protein